MFFPGELLRVFHFSPFLGVSLIPGHIPDGHFSDGLFPDGHFPDRHFPDQTHPRRTLPRPDTSLMDIFPTRQMPDKCLSRCIPQWTFPNQLNTSNNLKYLKSLKLLELKQRRSGNGCNVKITLDGADRFLPKHSSTLTQLIPRVTIY